MLPLPIDRPIRYDAAKEFDNAAGRKSIGQPDRFFSPFFNTSSISLAKNGLAHPMPEGYSCASYHGIELTHVKPGVQMGCAVVAAVALTIALGLPAAAPTYALTKASTQDYQAIFLRRKSCRRLRRAPQRKSQGGILRGLKWIDKFDYPAAMQHFNKAVDAQPNNMLLRYVAIQMAIYMGNTRKGKQAVEYFDMALTNLNALDTSTQLNSREKERVAKYLDVVGKLQDAVGQRDLMRNKYGRELAKQYAAYVYKKEEKDEKNKTPEQEALERTGAMPQGVAAPPRPKQAERPG